MKRKKILFLQKRLLFPTDTGGKIRTLNVLRHLAKWHEVTYLSNLLPAEEPYLKEMQELNLKLITIPWSEALRGSWRFYRDLAWNLFSTYPFNVNKDYDPQLRNQAKQLLLTEDFDLLICDFVQMARNCLGFSKVAKLLFEHNAEAQVFQRHANSSGGLLRRAYMGLQWKKMLRYEGAAGRDFDRVVAVSEQDQQFFKENYGWSHVDVIETAVDTDYFQPQPTSGIPGRCVFVGSMDWLPNEEGVKKFVQEVWPLIRVQHPQATFHVVGRNPPPSIAALDGKIGVTVTGSVPDVRPHLAEAQVVVIPLWVGGGTRLKVFEAMAMQKPIVSTRLGVEGLKVTEGKNVALADTAEELAKQVASLLSDSDLRHRLAENGKVLVQAKFTTKFVAKQFNAICLKTIESKQMANNR